MSYDPAYEERMEVRRLTNLVEDRRMDLAQAEAELALARVKLERREKRDA